MLLRKLDPTFYTENAHLKEALDNHHGNWERGKTRGYGIAVITITKDLKFAIPLRTNIKHSASYITVKQNRHASHGKGLDFSKALLIEQPSYVSSEVFKIPSEEFKILRSKSRFITLTFEKYVNRYVGAVNSNDNNILASEEYRFCTLINYHPQLGLSAAR